MYDIIVGKLFFKNSFQKYQKILRTKVKVRVKHRVQHSAKSYAICKNKNYLIDSSFSPF